MRRSTGTTIMGFIVVAGCAADPTTKPKPPSGGKADGPGAVPTDGTWSHDVISGNAMLWNGGPIGWGAGTSIAIRQDGHPIVAYYDSSYRCNNGGFGTYSPDTLMVARVASNAWNPTIAACGPNAGYFPRLRVDDQDRTHVLYGAGWYSSGQQRAFYTRWSASDQVEVSNAVDSAYMMGDALALALDDTGAPIVVSDGALVNADGTKVRLFASDTSDTFAERDPAGTLHVVGNTFVPDPNDPNTRTARLRYARRDASGVTVEIPRMQPIAVALGLVLDSSGTPHVLSWNSAAMGGGELWHTVRTATGWVDELIASDISSPTAALAIDANDELFVVAPGQVFRHASGATSWTSTAVSQLSSASYMSAVVAPDGALHVAFEVVGPIMSNDESRASVYHAAFHP
jgi:hypothetical protein